MPLVLEDIDWAQGQDNTAGVQQSIYFINMADLIVGGFPALPKMEDATTLEELVTVAGNLVLKEGTKPARVYGTLEKGASTSESQGEFDCVSFKNGFKFFHPGNKAKADGFVRFMKNGSYAVVYAELDGTVRLLGWPGYPAKLLSAPGTSGEKTADSKGRTFTMQSVWGGPAPVFTGKVMIAETEYPLDFLK